MFARDESITRPVFLISACPVGESWIWLLKKLGVCTVLNRPSCLGSAIQKCSELHDCCLESPNTTDAADAGFWSRRRRPNFWGLNPVWVRRLGIWCLPQTASQSFLWWKVFLCWNCMISAKMWDLAQNKWKFYINVLTALCWPYEPAKWKLVIVRLWFECI